jgi:hypothetical protein
MRDLLPPEIRSAIHSLLVEIARHRPLTRAEIHLRRTMAPLPWRDEGLSPSGWHRRRKRSKLAADQVVAS